MMRASISFIILIVLLGVPAILSGSAYVGQVLFAILLVLFLGTLAEAFTDRVGDDR